MRIPLENLAARAKERPEGYLEDVLGRGKVDGDELELSDEAFQELVKRYATVIAELPKFWEMISNFEEAMIGWAKSGFKTASKEEFKRRITVCSVCPNYKKALELEAFPYCSACGCSGFKPHLATVDCPLGLWSAP
jgi:hypothetical protein